MPKTTRVYPYDPNRGPGPKGALSALSATSGRSRLPWMAAFLALLSLSLPGQGANQALAVDSAGPVVLEASPEDSGGDSSEAEAAGPADPQQDASSPAIKSSPLSINGYLSQGYGAADATTTLGLPTDGTTDYRNAALLFRYDASPRDSLVIQLSHERQGDSSGQNQDVELDWAFYKRGLGGESSIKVGRIPIPKGIFNEVRDVGTLLPFFRPPVSIYAEEIFVSENLDGVVVSRSFAPRSLWKTELDFYYGRWEISQLAPVPAEVEDAVGVQVWLSTPVQDLSFGGGVQRQDVDGLFFLPPGVEEEWIEWHVSGEWELLPIIARGEARRIDFEATGRLQAFYLQFSVRATSELTFNAQYEEEDITFSLPGSPLENRTDLMRSFALGVNYAFRPDLILKLENHWGEGFFVDTNLPNYFARVVANEAFDTDHMILSLAFSF